MGVTLGAVMSDCFLNHIYPTSDYPMSDSFLNHRRRQGVAHRGAAVLHHRRSFAVMPSSPNSVGHLTAHVCKLPLWRGNEQIELQTASLAAL